MAVSIYEFRLSSCLIVVQDASIGVDSFPRRRRPARHLSAAVETSGVN